MQKVLVGKLMVSFGTAQEICKAIISESRQQSLAILPCSLNDLVWMEKNEKIKEAYKIIDLIVPDGMPLVWWIRRKGFKTDRIYGPSLMLKLLEMQSNARHAFYGSSEETLKKLTDKIQKTYPLLNTLTISPPFRVLHDYEEEEYIRRILMFNPKFLWIGISSPKQVVLAAKWKKRFPNTTIVCVGAAFDFIAGTKKQAPFWIQNIGLEWFFRILSEPRRLSKRYLIDIPLFLINQLIPK